MDYFSGYLTKIKKLAQKNDVQDLFGYVGYEKDFFIMEGGALACIFCCQPTAGCNEDMLNTWQAMYKRILPADTTLAIQLVALPNIAFYLSRYETIRGNRMVGDDNEMTEGMAKSLANELEEKVFTDMASGARLRDFELWFTIKVPTLDQVPSSKEINRFSELVQNIQTDLEGSHHCPVKLTPDALLIRLMCLFNCEKGAQWRDHNIRFNPSKSLNEQIVESGKIVRFNAKNVIVGVPEDGDNPSSIRFEKKQQTVISVLSMSQMPERMYYGQMYDLLGNWQHGNKIHSDPFIVSLLVHYPEQNSAKGKIAKERKWLLGQAKGKMLEWFTALAAQKNDYDQFWHEISELNEQIVNAGLHIIVFSSDEERANATTSSMISYFTSKKMYFTREAVITGPLLLQNIPGMMDTGYCNFRRHSVYTSKAMAFLTPNMASWKGNTDLPVVPFSTRLGQLFWFDLFRSDGGFNFFVSAKTGSGKSVLVNYLIFCYLNSGIKKGGSLRRKSFELDYHVDDFDDGAQVFLLDSGRSYENLAKMFNDSQFITFGADFAYSLNPFPSVDAWSGQDGQGPQILTMFKAMAAPKHGVTEEQRAGMMTMLTNMWNELGKKATVTEFVRRCRAHPEKYMQKIGVQLDIFAEGGVYGHLFDDKKPSINFDGRLVVIELEELNTDQHLQLVVMLGIITQIQHRIFMGSTSRKSLFLLEEAWQWMTGDKDGEKGALIEFVGEFLQAAFRKFRKVRASGGVITQTYMDAAQNAVGQALLANTDYKIFLQQNSDVISRLQESKVFNCTPFEFEQMKTVKTNKGVYSELMIFNGGNSEICRLELAPETLMIFSTDPDDRELMKKYRAKGYSIEEAAKASALEKMSI